MARLLVVVLVLAIVALFVATCGLGGCSIRQICGDRVQLNAGDAGKGDER